ncbi:MAG: hypothetical protein IH598_01785, partial [Bacteroidales bacterium]|nr:hypothetical protein [Bacteroidales bacterium]
MIRSLLFMSLVCAYLTSGYNLNAQSLNRLTPSAILPELTVDPNTEIVVPVTVNNMAALQTLSVSFTYDPAILTYVNFSFSGGVLTSSLYNRQVNQIGNNKIQFVFTAKSPLFMYTGSGVVGSIIYQTGLFGTSPLIFAEFLVNGTTYLSNTINGEVIITDCLNAFADAGQDASILAGQLFLLQPSASNYSGVQWETQGDGFFNNPAILQPFYTPGPQDIANGSVNLCLTAYGIAPCIDDTDCMVLTIVQAAPPQAVLPVLFADPGTLVSVPVNANLLQQVTSLTVTFSYDPTVLTYTNFNFTGGVLTPGLYNRQFNQLSPNLVQFIFTAKSPLFTFSGSGKIGTVEFTAGNFGTSPLVFTQFSVNGSSYLNNVINGHVFISDCLNATANAGSNATICEDETYTLGGSASNYQSLKWISEGDGNFSSTTILNPIYTPGSGDIINGGVELCLVAYTGAPCLNDTSCMFLTISALPVVTLEAFPEYCEGDEAFTLSGGLPEGGTYFVDGVEATMFDPVMAGTYEVVYVYTNSFDCTNSATGLIVVNTLPIVTCPEDFKVCINNSPFQLTGALPEGGVYSGNGVADGIFNAEMAGLGTHLITYNYSDMNGCGGSCSFSITVTALPSVDAGDDASICQDGSSYQLNGSVENAESYFWFTLLGTGEFDNQNALNAVYTPGPVDYILGSVELCLQATSVSPCSDDVVDCMTLYFYPEVVVTCPTNFPVCINADPFQLTGALPEGGVYSGNGVADGIFNAEVAGLGTHLITYNYSDINGCGGSCSFSITVTALPSVDAGDDASICQDGSSYQLNGSVENAESYFWFTLLGIGEFDNQNALNAVYTPGPVDYILGSVELCLQATSISPCSDDVVDCMTLYFYPEVVVTCPPNFPVCINADPFQLTGALPEGGVYSGNGVVDGIFDAEVAGLGTHLITYNYSDMNGCGGSCSFSITVTALPSVDAGDDASICQDGSSYQLNGSVENAESYFWFTLLGTGEFDNQNALNA